MRKLLKDAKVSTIYPDGILRNEYQTRLENIRILKTTDKSWLIEFPVRDNMIQMWFPKSICVLWKRYNILSVPQWYYKHKYPKSTLVWQENFNCIERNSR